MYHRGARKLTGENLKVVWAEFSTLVGPFCYVCNYMAYREACLSLELQTRPRFRPVSLSLSMVSLTVILQSNKLETFQFYFFCL